MISMLTFFVLATLASTSWCSTAVKRVDVLIYGATPSGISAALSAKRVNSAKSVALVESSNYIGGMSSPGGIGLRDFRILKPCCTMQDWGMLNAQYYNSTDPVWQPDSYVGETNFWKLLNKFNISVYRNEEVVAGSVVKSNTRIQSVNTTNIMWVADIFIDSSYEGLIMREVASHTWGRESIAQYSEAYAGVRQAGNPPFRFPVNATWPNGTLLRYVNGDEPAPFGLADTGVMGWSYRLCVTQRSNNRVSFATLKPEGYNADDFELMRRYVDSYHQNKVNLTMKSIFALYPYSAYPPGDKFDLCDSNSGPVTSDVMDEYVQGYINGTKADRAKTQRAVEYYVKGTIYFLSTDPRVPQVTQADVNSYGLCADQWPENSHFPPQMYVREALRMVGDSVFTQNDWNATTVKDPIAVGSWGLDIHVVHRRATAQGLAYNEGYLEPGTGAQYFELPLSLIMPKRAQVTNMLSTVTISCTHVTWACLREEPTLWKLGMAAGTTAALLQPQQAVQDVPYSTLTAELEKQGVTTHL